MFFVLQERTDGVVDVHRRRTDDQNYPEDIFRARTLLRRTDLRTVEALCMPWLPYRKQWDDLLESSDTIRMLADGSRLTHHITRKKFTLGARDSVCLSVS